MGYFSWKTSDTKQSISNSDSSRSTFSVYVIWPDGSFEREDDYEGYGVFDDVDVYEKIAKLNGRLTRSDGITIVAKNNPSCSLKIAAENGIIVPKFAESLDKKYEELDHSENCEYQGFFYPEDDDNDL